LAFDDLGARYGLAKPVEPVVEWFRFNNESREMAGMDAGRSLELPAIVSAPAETRYYAAKIRGAEPAKAVTVFIRAGRGPAEVVGVERSWAGLDGRR
jgi:hypothetical protein